MPENIKTVKLNIISLTLYVFLVMLGLAVIMDRPFGLPAASWVLGLSYLFLSFQVLTIVRFIVGILLSAIGLYGLYRHVSFKDLPFLIRIFTSIILITLVLNLLVTVYVFVKL